jgi:hypothetical protein
MLPVPIDDDHLVMVYCECGVVLQPKDVEKHMNEKKHTIAEVRDLPRGGREHGKQAEWLDRISRKDRSESD